MLYIQSQSKSKNLSSLFLLCFLLLSFNVTALTVGTYNSPPFSMHEDGEDIGLATEAVRNLLRKSDIKHYTIVSYPLARGLVELKYGRVDIYYPYVKGYGKETENYVLIGPISKYRVSLFVRKDYTQKVSLTAMKNLVVGAERGSIGDMVLTKNNINVEQATQDVSCLKMVLADRISACAMGTLPGVYSAAINNMYHQLRYVETNEYEDMYVALGSNLSKELVKRIQDAYSALKQENYFEIQQKDYEKKFNVFIKSLS